MKKTGLKKVTKTITKSTIKVFKRLKTMNKKTLLICGVITTVIIGGVSYTLFKPDPKINNKSAQHVEVVSEDTGEKELFLEAVTAVKSGISKAKVLVFGDETISITETFGSGSNNFIEVAGSFDVKYGIDLSLVSVKSNEEDKTINLSVPITSIGVNSVTLDGDMKKTYQEKSFMTKVVEIIPGVNKDDEIMENAMNQLMVNAKKEANDYNSEAVNALAEDELIDLIETFNILQEITIDVEFI